MSRFLHASAVCVCLAAPVAGAEAAAAASNEPISWLAEYLALDTSNPPGNEERAVAFLRRVLHAEGVSTRLFVSPDGRPSLYARLPASQEPGKGTIVLLHHMDVVPEGPGWTVDPFSAVERDGALWGRGAIDAKSLGIAHLASFLGLYRARSPLAFNVVFLAVADEETGGKEGTGWLLDAYPELFADTVAVLGEGGVNRAHGGRLLWWGVEVAQKRPLWLRLTARGRSGHGSMLNLGSAPHTLAQALARLLDRPLRYRVSPPVRQYLEAVAPLQSDFFRSMVESLDEIVTAPEPHTRMFPGVPNYLLDTVQVNVLAAGEKINVTPASASALVDIRLLPDTDDELFLEDVREALGPDIEIDVLLQAPPASPSSTENPLFACLARELPGRRPVVPSFIPGVTDSRYFRQRGIDAYGFSPFVLDGGEALGVHGPDEKIPLDVVARGVDTMREVLRACVSR